MERDVILSYGRWFGVISVLIGILFVPAIPWIGALRMNAFVVLIGILCVMFFTSLEIRRYINNREFSLFE